MRYLDMIAVERALTAAQHGAAADACLLRDLAI
jgi:hypothetical protein